MKLWNVYLLVLCCLWRVAHQGSCRSTRVEIITIGTVLKESWQAGGLVVNPIKTNDDITIFFQDPMMVV